MDLGHLARLALGCAVFGALLGLASPGAAGDDGADVRKGDSANSSADSSVKQSAETQLTLTKLSPGCYAVTRAGCRSNAGFVVGEDSVLVIDCFDSPDAGEQLVREVKRVTDKPIRHVALTNEFYDHVVGNQSMPEEATIYASQQAGLRLMERLKKDRMLLAPAAGGIHASIGFLKVREPTQAVKGKTEIDLGGLKVSLLVAGEGYGAGDMVVWVPTEKVLFAGNLLWNGCHPNLVSGSTFLWIRSLAAIERLDVGKVVPGHGELADKTHLAKQRRYLMILRATVKHLARSEIAIEKIVEGIKPSEDYADYAFAAYWPKNVLFVHGELMRNR